MQHAGLQYGQGAANSHQSPPFTHGDISQMGGGGTGGNATSSLRHYRKKDGNEKTNGTDLTINSENVARVPPHNHYPARPNEYYRYHPQYAEYACAPQVKYSEIAENHKESHKDFMEMCNTMAAQQSHVKSNFDNLTTGRQQAYSMDTTSVHNQYLHKDPQVQFKGESHHQQYISKEPPPPPPQYQQYAHLTPTKYHNHQTPLPRKYIQPSVAAENDFLAQFKRINPTMARTIINHDHQVYNEQNRTMYHPNQRNYYPNPMQNNTYNYASIGQPPYTNYSSCNYGNGARYPSNHHERSLSPRRYPEIMNYSNVHQKVATYGGTPQYAPEYAQHYQHRRGSTLPQEYLQQSMQRDAFNPLEVTPENERRSSSSGGGGLRHFIENWAEEEIVDGNEQVYVINSTDLTSTPHIESVSLVPTENGQYIIKSGSLDNSLVRIKETTENNGERTVNLQIIETPNQRSSEEVPNSCAVLAAETSVIVNPVEKEVHKDMPMIELEASQPKGECDKSVASQEKREEVEDKLLGPTTINSTTKRTQRIFSVDDIIGSGMTTGQRRSSLQLNIGIDEKSDRQHEKDEANHPQVEEEQSTFEPSKSGGENHAKCDKEPSDPTDVQDSKSVASLSTLDQADLETDKPSKSDKETPDPVEEPSKVDAAQSKLEQEHLKPDREPSKIDEEPSRIPEQLSSDAIPEQTTEETEAKTSKEDKEEEVQYRDAILIEDDSVILEIGGAIVQLTVNHINGTKVLSVASLSEPLLIDINGNHSELPLEEKKDDEKPLEDAFDVEENVEKLLQQTDDPQETIEDPHEETVEDRQETIEVPEETVEDHLGTVEDPREPDEFHKEPTSEIEEKLEDEDILTSEDVGQSEIIIGEDLTGDSDVFLPSIENQPPPNEETEKEETVQDEVSVSVTEEIIEDIANVMVEDNKNSTVEEISEECKETTEDVTQDIVECNRVEDVREDTSVEDKLTETPVEKECKRTEIASEKEDKNEEICQTQEEIIEDSKTNVLKIERASDLKEECEEKPKKLQPSKRRKSEETSSDRKKDVRAKRPFEETDKNKVKAKRNKKMSESPREKSSKSVCEPEMKKKEVLIKTTEDTVKNIAEKKQKDAKNRCKHKASTETKKPIEKIDIAKKQQNEDKPVVVIKEHEKKIATPKTFTTKASKKLYDCSKSEAKTTRIEETVKKIKEKMPKKVSFSKQGSKAPAVVKKSEVNLKKREGMLKKNEEASKKREETLKKSEETLKKSAETLKKSEEALKKNEESSKKSEEPAKKCEKTLKKSEESPKKSEEIPKRVEETLKKPEPIIPKPTKLASEPKKIEKKPTAVKIEEKPKPPVDTSKQDTEEHKKRLEIELLKTKEEERIKKLSWAEYANRKKLANETTKSIASDCHLSTVTTNPPISDEVVEQVEVAIETAIYQKKIAENNNWEDDDDEDEEPPHQQQSDVVAKQPIRQVIDVNEFNIKPMEPSPPSCSVHLSESDSLETYREVVDSKLNSLDIKIPSKMVKPPDAQHFMGLIEKFLTKKNLNSDELSKVRKIIEFKRLIEDSRLKKMAYEVEKEREDLKLHLKKVPPLGKRKRFRNLYIEDSESEEEHVEEKVDNYSVHQRESHLGVPKLIFKRKSMLLPQPFVKLERSQAVELLAKKRKLN